jgi:hypothetical protein
MPTAYHQQQQQQQSSSTASLAVCFVRPSVKFAAPLTYSRAEGLFLAADDKDKQSANTPVRCS